MSGAPGGQRAGVPHSPCPKSLADMGMGMGMSLPGSSRVCNWGGPWDCRLGVTGCQPAGTTSLTLFSAVPLPGCPSSTPAE